MHIDGKCGPSGTKYSVYTGVKTWLGAGFPAKKLILGVPSYGYGYRTLSSSLATTNYGGKPSLLYQTASATTPVAGKTADPAGTDVCGNPTGRGGQWLFRELVQNGMVSTGGSKAKGGKGYTRYFDSCSSTVRTVASCVRPELTRLWPVAVLVQPVDQEPDRVRRRAVLCQERRLRQESGSRGHQRYVLSRSVGAIVPVAD